MKSKKPISWRLRAETKSSLNKLRSVNQYSNEMVRIWLVDPKTAKTGVDPKAGSL